MTLLTIATTVAKNVGLAIPTEVVGSAQREWKELLCFANETGEELARRVDWGQLTQTATLIGSGNAAEHDLPSGFQRLTKGASVIASGSIVRPLTQAEFSTLTGVEGVPRYFLLRQNKIEVWPYLGAGATATAIYQSGFWCDNGTAAFASDDDASLIEESLFAKGVEVRWRRQKGMDYADHEAEFEAALADYAAFNDKSRL